MRERGTEKQGGSTPDQMGTSLVIKTVIDGIVPGGGDRETIKKLCSVEMLLFELDQQLKRAVQILTFKLD